MGKGLDKALRGLTATPAEYIEDLQKVVLEVGLRLKCLPCYAAPAPDDGNKHIIQALDNLKCSEAYYKALVQTPRANPSHVPARVRLPRKIHSSGPDTHVLLEPGEYDCICSTRGDVSVNSVNGQFSQAIGVVGSEFEVIAWRENK